jgi:hypothetical protein
MGPDLTIDKWSLSRDRLYGELKWPGEIACRLRCGLKPSRSSKKVRGRMARSYFVVQCGFAR